MPRLDGSRGEEGLFASRALAVGIRVSGALLAAGLILHAVRPASLPAGPPDWSLVLRSACAGHGEALTFLGIVTLIATPYLRVLLVAAAFARGRQWRMLAVSLAVLGMLCAGILLGWRRAASGALRPHADAGLHAGEVVDAARTQAHPGHGVPGEP